MERVLQPEQRKTDGDALCFVVCKKYSFAEMLLLLYSYLFDSTEMDQV